MEACQQSLNDRISETQESVPKWSCCSICLRIGVFILFLLKMVVNLVLLELLFMVLCAVIFSSSSVYDNICVLLAYVAMYIDAVDFIMGFAIIISYCTKYEKYMELYHRRSIYVFILLSALCCSLMYMILHNVWNVIKLLFLLTPCLLIQLCVNYVVKKDIPAMRSDDDCRV